MKYCMLIPKSSVGATWYCTIDQIFKQFANAYSLEGFHAWVKMDDYTVRDATYNKVAVKMLKEKGY